MKFAVVISLIIMSLLVTSCRNDILKPEEMANLPDKSAYGYLFGTYDYYNVFVESDNNPVALKVESLTYDRFMPFYIIMNHKSGYFIFNLKPGDYKLSKMVYWNGGERDGKEINIKISITNGVISYMGKLVLYVNEGERSTTPTFYKKINYGIESFSDKLEKDKDILDSKYKDISNFPVINLVTKK